jgi:hypothetical protein
VASGDADAGAANDATVFYNVTRHEPFDGKVRKYTYLEDVDIYCVHGDHERNEGIGNVRLAIEDSTGLLW